MSFWDILPWRHPETENDIAEARTVPAKTPDPGSSRQPERAGYLFGVPEAGLDEIQAGMGASTGTDRKSMLQELYEAYLACPWSWSCVNAIARTVTSGGLVTDWDQDTGEGNQDAPDKPPEVLALETFLDFCNPTQDIRQVLRNAVADLEVFGGAYLEVAWWGSIPVAIWNQDFPTTTPIADEHGAITGYVQVSDYGQRAKFETKQIIYISLDSARAGVFGVSPTQAMMGPITAWLFGASTGKELFRKGLPANVHVDLPSSMSEPETRRWSSQYLSGNLGAKNIGRPIITRNGGKVNQLQAGKVPDVLAFLDQKRDEIVAGYGVPPAKAGIIESGNLGGGTADGQDVTYRVDTCGPIADLILEKLNFHITAQGFGITDWKLKFGEVDYRASLIIEQIRDMRLRNGTWCVDVETEILTQAGWKTHETLRAGDVVLTLNHETGNSEWQECQEVCVFPDAPREMIRMRSRAHSSLTTVDHRWPVENYSPRRKVKEWRRRWVTSETMTIWDRVLTAAPNATLPVESKYDDAFVELIAWFWTEGHAPPRNQFVLITQKIPAGIERIRTALEKVFGPPYERSKYHRKTDAGAWIEKPKQNGTIDFRIAASHGHLFREIVEDHVVKNEFLLSLTQEQLDLFIEISIMADGWTSRGYEVLTQRRQRAAEQFQFACILAGRAATISPFQKSDRPDYRMWKVNVSKINGTRPLQAVKQSPGAVVERVTHNGVVWCPVTPNESWMARRDGTVYFTGNTRNKYATEIGEPSCDGGNDPVLVDRQNIILWSDISAMSKAIIAGKGAAAVTAGETPPGGEQLTAGVTDPGSGPPDNDPPATATKKPAPPGQPAAPPPAKESWQRRYASYRKRFSEALDVLPPATGDSDDDDPAATPRGAVQSPRDQPGTRAG